MVASVVVALAFGAVLGSAAPAFSNSSSVATDSSPTIVDSAAPTGSANATQASCYASYNDCRSVKLHGVDVNFSTCAAEYADCLGYNPFTTTGASSATPVVSISASSIAASAGTSIASTNSTGVDCLAKYNDCRSVKLHGVDVNFSTCASEYAACLGYNPFTTTGANTATPVVSLSASSTAAPASSATESTNSTSLNCLSKYNDCRSVKLHGVDVNFSTCAAEYADCLGYNPFASNGTNTVPLPIPVGTPVTTTEVVTSFTTYCPAPTTLTVGGKTYTVTEATTLTVTDCPCTLTKVATPTVYTTTEIVSTITTYCPQPTTVTIDKHTYTVTEATTLICPVTQTITKPVDTAIPTISAYTTTEVVTAYTTYCPQPTTVTVDKHMYTVTEATTLTIPVTVTYTKPVEPTTASAATTKDMVVSASTTEIPSSPTCAPIYITVTETQTITVGAGPPVTTSIPGGCNPAHPGSCPSSYFSTAFYNTTAPAAATGGYFKMMRA